VSALPRYRDMKLDDLKALIKRTENERARHRQKFGESSTVASFDAQIAEAKEELKRRDKR
jgi:hypothetical protein